MGREALCALRGGVGFLTRLPTPGAADRDWEAFRRTPAAFPAVGAIVGALAAGPLLAAGTLPAPTAAFGYLAAIYLLTGVHHLDGVADLGDAVAVHGDARRRREAMTDTTTGVGAVLAVSVVVAGVALAGLGLAALPVAVAVSIAIAAEVGAKLAMAAVACFGTAGHEGLGSRFTAAVGPSSFALPAGIALLAAVALPAAVALSAVVVPAAVAPPAVAVPAAVGLPAELPTWPTVGAGSDGVSTAVAGSDGAPTSAVAGLGGPLLGAVAGLGGALVGAAVPWLWARRRLGGVSGDVFGAANEVGRVAGLHAGVIAWTLS